MVIRLVLSFLLLFSAKIYAQQNEYLYLNEYYDLVKVHHPVAKQAVLLIRQGKLAVKEARGAFDPKWTCNNL